MFSPCFDWNFGLVLGGPENPCKNRGLLGVPGSCDNVAKFRKVLQETQDLGMNGKGFSS